MGFFDSLSDLVLGTNSNAEDAAAGINLDLGNIFLPGGLQGGVSNTKVPGGVFGSPFNQTDYDFLVKNWQAVRGQTAGHLGKGNWSWWDDPDQNPLSAEAKRYITHVADSGGLYSSSFGQTDWNKYGAVGYATPEGAPGEGTPSGSAEGSLDPARSMFANIAAGAPMGNAQGDILNLLRQQALPFENRAFQNINQNLFSRGRLGGDDSATGEAYRGFSRGLAEADTGRQLASYGLSDELQTNQLNRQLNAAQGAAGLTELSTLPFQLALKLAMAKSGAAAAQSGAINASGGDSLLGAFTSLFGGGGAFGKGGRWGG